MTARHTIKAFDEELAALRAAVGEMGDRVRAELAMALRALLEGELALASEAVKSDTRVNELQQDINAQILRVIARRQPVAQDLREVIVAGRIANDLERVGDHAKAVAHRAWALGRDVPEPALRQLRRLGERVEPMLASVMEAYGEADADKAHRVWMSDAELDEVYAEFFRQLLMAMKDEVDDVTPYTHLMFIAKSLERVGDHATNIAEDVTFMVTGQPVTQPRPKGRGRGDGGRSGAGRSATAPEGPAASSDEDA